MSAAVEKFSGQLKKLRKDKMKNDNDLSVSSDEHVDLQESEASDASDALVLDYVIRDIVINYDTYFPSS